MRTLTDQFEINVYDAADEDADHRDFRAAIYPLYTVDDQPGVLAPDCSVTLLTVALEDDLGADLTKDTDPSDGAWFGTDYPMPDSLRTRLKPFIADILQNRASS